jgi:hypothetical protein
MHPHDGRKLHDAEHLTRKQRAYDESRRGRAANPFEYRVTCAPLRRVERKRIGERRCRGECRHLAEMDRKEQPKSFSGNQPQGHASGQGDAGCQHGAQGTQEIAIRPASGPAARNSRWRR